VNELHTLESTAEHKLSPATKVTMWQPNNYI